MASNGKQELVRSLITSFGQAPRLYAHTQEAFIAQITILLIVAGVDAVHVQRYHEKIFGIANSALVDTDKLLTPVQDEWARDRVAEALKILNES